MKIFSCLLKNRFTIPMEKSKDFILSKCLIFFFLAIGANNLSAAAISWDGGGGDGNWFTATNWSGDVLPGAADDVTISSAGIVTFGSSATIKSLSLANSTLTLSASGSLTISGSTGIGITMSGTTGLNNSGTIKIDNTGSHGIHANGNHTITNSKTIEIGKTGAIGGQGISMKNSSLTNQSLGTLSIDNTSSHGIKTDNAASITNAGIIEIGQNHQISGNGIEKSSSPDISNTGTLRVDNCTSVGINLQNGKFANHHIIEIGKNASIGGHGIVVKNAMLENKSGAVLSIDNTSDGIRTSNVATITNAGTLNIGQNAAVSGTGINHNGSASFTNSGTITLGNSFSVVSGISSNTDALTNTGTLNFENILGTAILSGTTVNNTGMAVVGSGHTMQNAGVFNNNVGGTFTNNGTFNNTGTFNQSGTFTNNSTFKNTTGTFNQSGTFTNASGSFIEPGNSPGTLTITGDMSLGSSTLVAEINGTTASTQYDVLNITGTGTIVNGSSKLSLVFGYTAAVNDAFDIITTGTLSGTFAMSDISFSGGDVLGVSVTYPGGGVVRVTVTSILPVELVKFEAVNKHEDVLLLWQTATETNNQGFEIQRSTDGSTWSNIAYVNGHGTTLEAQSYTFTDERPMTGMNYYRLKQVDFDGGFDYSHVVSVDLRSLQDLGSLGLYPNPAKGSVTLSVRSDFVGDASLVIFDLLGNQVGNQILSLEGGAFNTNFEISDLPAGVYLVDVTAGNEKWQEWLVMK